MFKARKSVDRCDMKQTQVYRPGIFFASLSLRLHGKGNLYMTMKTKNTLLIMSILSVMLLTVVGITYRSTMLAIEKTLADQWPPCR